MEPDRRDDRTGSGGATDRLSVGGVDRGSDPAPTADPTVGPAATDPEPVDSKPVDPENFNPVLDLGRLPTVDEERFSPLDPNLLKARWTGDAVFAAIVIVVALMVAVAAPIPTWIPLLVGAGLLVLTAIGAVLQRIEVSRMGYLVREHDVSYRRGVISQSVSTIPFARVQHVSIERGAVARLFGLATLEIRAARGGIEVSGLANEEADRLKALIVARAGSSAAAEGPAGDSGAR